jgi:hypothetical protein
MPTRKAFPYTPFDNRVEEREGIPSHRPRLPMDAPDLIFRNHYNTPSETRRGELGNTLGSLAVVVPIQTPHDTTAGGPGPLRPNQGLTNKKRLDGTIASNTVTGGVVKGYITDNDTIRIKVLVSRNLYSPTSHARDATRLAASGRIPPQNAIPSKDRGMPPTMGKRGTGGNYTIPAPEVFPSWPTSAQWLRNRFK